jgi:hypothetical protein
MPFTVVVAVVAVAVAVVANIINNVSRNSALYAAHKITSNHNHHRVGQRLPLNKKFTS